MNEAHGKGIATLLSWLNASVERDRARALVDGLTDLELADVLDVVAAAHLAEGNKGSVLLESAAARLRGVDVEHDGSGDRAPADVVEEPPFCGATVGEVGRCLKRLGHTGDHTSLITTQVRELHVPPALELVECGESAGDDITKRCTLDRGHRGACAHFIMPEVA